jgi:hypothetical protein
MLLEFALILALAARRGAFREKKSAGAIFGRF